MIDAANILKNSVKDVPANNCELLNVQGLFISCGLEQRLHPNSSGNREAASTE